MKAGSLLTDTNAIVHYMNNDFSARAVIDGADELYVPAVALGELLFGAKNSMKAKQNVDRIEQFMRRTQVLPCDEFTSIVYSDIRLHLKNLGKPIPDNDTWIAAIALQYELPLMSRDRHFQHVPGMHQVAW